jgi:pyridoxine 5-phosphate synthase
MTKLSVNINKIATLRNARGGNVPNLLKAAIDIERFGAQGITVHPRPDERHITYQDVHDLSATIKTEFNIEGNPKEKKFIELVLNIKPKQVTLVPDVIGQITSDHGWDTVKEKDFLIDTIACFKAQGIRTSIFVDPNLKMIEAAKVTGTDRIELYTEEYARLFPTDKKLAIAPYCIAGKLAVELKIGVNAGHDLNLDNLKFFKEHVPELLEVSIGHALISDALYFGLENTVQLYLRQLK